jgi:arginine utilization protein RocB
LHQITLGTTKMSEINENSDEVQVADYVGYKLKDYKYVEELKQFIIDQAISGNIFLRLNDKELKQAGLHAFGKRKTLMELIKGISESKGKYRSYAVFLFH